MLDKGFIVSYLYTSLINIHVAEDSNMDLGGGDLAQHLAQCGSPK